MQSIAEKEILIVVALLVVHCCAFTKNVIVASRLYDVANVQFTLLEKEGLLKLLQLIQKYYLGNSVPNIVIMLRIFLTIAVGVATCEEFFETKTDQKLLKIWYEHLAVEKSCHTVYSAKIDRYNVHFDIAIEEFANKKARKVTV